MHKSMDLGYYIPEASLHHYPSLMSPLSSFSLKTPSKSKNIFERLQADTELRLRTRVNSVSAIKTTRKKTETPIEDKLIIKDKERQTRLRHLIEKEELRRSEEMQDRPYVSPNSKAILKEKSKNCSKNAVFSAKSEVLHQALENTKKNDLGLFKKNESSGRVHRKNLIKQLEVHYKFLCSKKKPKINPLEVRCVDRKYVPSFGKNEWKGLIPKTSSLGDLSSPNCAKGIKRKEIRPDKGNTSSSGIGFSQALDYQQIIRDRIVNLTSH